MVSARFPAVFAEDVTHFTDRAVAVVGNRIDDHRHAAGAVALVHDLFVVDAFFFAGAATNGALDVVGRHVDLLLSLIHISEPTRPY